MAPLCQSYEELEQLNAEVVVISFGSVEQARNWKGETCAPFGHLRDRKRVVYRLYGMERSTRRSWNLKTIWRYVQLLSQGRKWRGIQGDSAQLGGDIIIDSAGIVQLVHHSHDPTDRPPVSKLLAVLRKLDN